MARQTVIHVTIVHTCRTQRPMSSRVTAINVYAMWQANQPINKFGSMLYLATRPCILKILNRSASPTLQWRSSTKTREDGRPTTKVVRSNIFMVITTDAMVERLENCCDQHCCARFHISSDMDLPVFCDGLLGRILFMTWNMTAWYLGNGAFPLYT